MAPKKDEWEGSCSPTLASRILTQKKIPYRLATFPSREKDAEEVARCLKIPLRQVVKTLLLNAPIQGFFLALCPGDRQVDLKLLAHILKEKRVVMAAREEVYKVTGYFIGGVSPLGTRRELPVLMDSLVLAEKEISISAGRWGCQVLLDPHQLKEVLGPRLMVAVISQGSESLSPTP